MSELIDELEVGRWVKSKAEAATGLDAFLDLIPDTHPLPAVRFTFQLRHDVYTVEAHAPMTRFHVLVVVTIDNDMTPLATLRGYEQDLHDGLHRASGVVGGCNVLSCVRLGPFTMSEGEAAHMYRHAGGTYSVLARPAP
jgi:hypothetical protein